MQSQDAFYPALQPVMPYQQYPQQNLPGVPTPMVMPVPVVPAKAQGKSMLVRLIMIAIILILGYCAYTWYMQQSQTKYYYF